MVLISSFIFGCCKTEYIVHDTLTEAKKIIHAEPDYPKFKTNLINNMLYLDLENAKKLRELLQIMSLEIIYLRKIFDIKSSLENRINLE